MFSKKELISWDRKFSWHPFTQMSQWNNEIPLFIEKGDGNYLIDIDKKRYIDGVSSLWANVHGHNNLKLNQAISSQLQNIAHSTMLGLSNLPATLFAKKLIEVVPSILKKVFFSDTGSASNEIALKMAYQYWQIKGEKLKTKFITLKESYHGDTIGAVSLGGIDLFHKTFSSLLFDSFQIPSPFFYHSEFNSEKDCGDYSLSILENILKKYHGEIAGIFTESYIQGASGLIIFPRGFMKKMYDLCSKYNVLFIIDEVATGFGKTGNLFACEEDSLAPDIMTLGKGISGGYLPLAATLTTNEIYNAFLGDYKDYKSFFHGHTYTGNPLATSVAISSLELFYENNTLYHLKDIISFFSKSLKKLDNLDCVGDIRQKGIMIGIEIVKDRISKKSFDAHLKIGHKICMKIREYGVILRPLGDVIVIMPPLTILEKEVQIIVDSLYESIKEVTKLI